MTNILFAQPHDNSLRDNLSKLGESMFGNGAQNEMHRQEALKGRRVNEAAADAERYYNSGDYRRAGGASLRANPGATNMGTISLAGTALDPGASNATMDRVSVGAGHAPHYAVITGENQRNAATNATSRANNAATIVGAGQRNDVNNATSRANNAATIEGGRVNNEATNQTHILTNAATIEGGRVNNVNTNETSERNNRYTADRGYDREVYKHDNTPYVTYPEGIKGPSRITSQSEAIRTGARGAPPSRDQVIGGLIQEDEANPPPPGGFPKASMRTPDQRHMRGETTTVQHFVHQDTNEPVESHDGGLTFVDRAGRRGFLSGSGFVPSTEAQALPAARDALVQREASTPAPLPAASSGMADDAEATSGLLPAAKTHFNNSVLALPGAPSLAKAITGSPDVGPTVERASQGTRNMELRSLLTAFPGKPNKYSQQQLDELLPHGAAFANPASERVRADAVEKTLRNDRAEAAAIARSPTTLPDDRRKYVEHIRKIDALLRGVTGEQAPAEPADADALKWANENPSDPRAAKIRQLNGIK